MHYTVQISHFTLRQKFYYRAISNQSVKIQECIMSDPLSTMALRALYPNESTALPSRRTGRIPCWNEVQWERLLPSGAAIRQRRKRGRRSSSWRCRRRTCRKEIIIRARNPFFYGVTNPIKRDYKVSLNNMLKLIWH